MSEDAITQQQELKKQDPIRIVLPFKDQKSANSVRRQLGDLSRKINVDISPVYTSRKIKDEVKAWIIERLDRKLADAIGSNIVEKCDVTLSRAIQPLTSDVLRVLFFIAYFFIYISLSSTIRIAHVLK